MNDILETLIEVRIAEEEDFLKIKETKENYSYHENSKQIVSYLVFVSYCF